MPPPPHYLRRNEGNEAPWRWLFVDTETESREVEPGKRFLTLKFGMALFWHRGRPSHPEQLQWFRFTDTTSFIDLVNRLSQTKSRLILCAHNVQFDLAITGLLKHFTAVGWQVPYFVAGDGPTIIKLVSEDRTVLCVDSHNWLPFTLAEIGDRMDLPKLRMPDDDAPSEQWDTYCKRDVEIVYRAVRQWIERVQADRLGVFAFTLAGQAFAAFRHRFMAAKLVVDTDAAQLALARRAYYGGRVECYRLGTLPPDRYTLLDVNSLYPSVMATNVYPTRPLRSGYGASWQEQRRDMLPLSLIASVQITTDEPLYPLHKDGRLLFPVGTFTTTLAGPELELAVARGHVTAWGQWYEYDLAPLFHDFVSHFAAGRRACLDVGDMLGATLNKLLPNALYGKFAQRTPLWTQVATQQLPRFGSWDEYHVQSDQWTQYRTLGGTLYQSTESTDAPMAIPSISAFIASYARVELLRLIEKAGWEHVFRVDTDSVLVDSRGRLALSDELDQRQLGKLKIVDEGDQVCIEGQKHYTIDGRRTASGVKPNAVVLPDGTFGQDEFWGLTHTWNAGYEEGVIVQHVTKSLSRHYAAGVVQATGAVEPIRIGDA